MADVGDLTYIVKSDIPVRYVYITKIFRNIVFYCITKHIFDRVYKEFLRDL